jgi:hypothetical protein
MTAWPWVPDLVRTELTDYLDLAITMPDALTACPPWTVTDLTAHLVATFHRFRTLLRQSRSGDFLAEADNPMEMMAHQRGPIPVALQLLFGLNELVLHHHDMLPYRPERKVLEPLLDMWQRRFPPLPEESDPWHKILLASGRTV